MDSDQRAVQKLTIKRRQDDVADYDVIVQNECAVDTAGCRLT